MRRLAAALLAIAGAGLAACTLEPTQAGDPSAPSTTSGAQADIERTPSGSGAAEPEPAAVVSPAVAVPAAARPPVTAPAAPTLAPDRPPLRWSTGPGTAGGRRLALLVAADRYDEPNWDLPYALPTARAMADVLRRDLAFEADEVVLLSGDRVYADNVRATLRRLAAPLQGDDNVLLVLWVGHGFNIAGRQQYLTFPSRIQDGDYTATLAHDALTAWIGDACRDVASRGGELSSALVVDACRTRTSDAPRHLRDRVAGVDVEAFSASPGNPAAARATADVSLFTDALCASLSRAYGPRVGLLDALRSAVDVAAFQGAEITTGDADIVLLDRAALSLAVRVVDAFTGLPVPDTRVQLNGVEGGHDAVFQGLAETDEGYDLRVLADGYFWRSETVPFDRERAGDLLTVPLVPEFTALAGRLVVEGGGVARVKVTGAFPSAIDGYHVASATLPTGGPFLLRVPHAPGERSLVFEVNGVEARRVPFDMDAMPSELRSIGDATVRVLDFGAHSLSRARTGALLDTPVETRVIGNVEVAFDLSLVEPADFVDDRGWSFYVTVRAFLEDARYDDARRDLDVLLAGDRVRPAGRARLAALSRELEVAATMTRASELQAAGHLDAAIDVLDASEARDERRIRPVLLSWLDASARQRVQRDELTGAVARLEQAVALDPRDAALRERRREAHERWLAATFEEALASGDWPAVVATLDAVRGAATVDVPAWEQRIERESISPACRSAYERGIGALAAGELERAWDALALARADGCNAHYAQLVETHRRALADRLFAKYGAIAAERERAGDPVAAFVAYARASEYDPLVTHRLERLLDDPAVAAAEPGLVEEFRRRRDVRTALESVDSALANGDVESARARLVAAGSLPATDPVELARRHDAIDALVLQRAAERLAAREADLLLLGDVLEYGRLRYDDVDRVRRHAEEQWPGILTEEFVFVDVRRFSAGSSSFWIAVYDHERTGLPFALVPGGTLRMGSGSHEDGRSRDEGPQHDVALAPFLVARTEVSRRALAGAPDDVAGGDAAQLPATGLSWSEATDWCTSAGLSLPTEAQWEHACRAGTRRAYAFGDRIDGGLASIGRSEAVPVGSHGPNAFGLYDMHGNVWEWCRDWFGSYERNTRPGTGERLTTPTGLRAARGGAYDTPPEMARSAARLGSTPGTRSAVVGLRPVRLLE